jgi:HSP20 family protein
MSTLVKSNHGGPEQQGISGLVENFFQGGLNRVLSDDFWSVGGLSLSQHVPINIRENDKQYEMEVIAPGLRKGDFKLNLSHNMLTISFDHEEEDRMGENGRWIRSEYRTRSFRRSFNLDEGIDPKNVKAKYNDGILKVTIPKKEGTQTPSQSIKIE